MEYKKKNQTGRSGLSKNVQLKGANKNNNIIDIGSSNYHPRQLKTKLEVYLSEHGLNLPTKRGRMIAWLVVCSGVRRKVTRFDAEWVSDHCWNTTVSEIQRIDGIEVKRKQVKVPSKFGLVDCKAYWLDGAGIKKAKKYLGVAA